MKIFILFLKINGRESQEVFTSLSWDDPRQAAMSRLADLGKYNRIEGHRVEEVGIIEEGAPAPIDWAEETNSLFHLREKAIAYITEHTESAFYEYSGADIVYADADDKRMITVGWDGEDSNEAQTEEVEDLDISVLADLCVVIQKAIAG